MTNSSVRLLAEIDSNTIRFLISETHENYTTILFEETYPFSIWNIENEIFEFKNIVNSYFQLNNALSRKIDLVYKDDIFEIQETDFQETLSYSGVQLGVKNIQTLLNKMVNNYHKNHKNHYVISINPYQYCDVDKENNILKAIDGEFTTLRLTHKRIKIASKIVYADNQIINDFKSAFSKIGLEIGKIYSFVEILNSKLKAEVDNSFVSIHLDKNYTYISSGNMLNHEVIDFGEHTFIKFIMAELNIPYKIADKHHHLYQSYLELNSTGSAMQSLQLNTRVFELYTKLLERYWSLIIEQVRFFLQNKKLILSGSFNFMGRMKNIPINIFANNSVLYIEDKKHSQLFNVNQLSCDFIGKINSKVSERNLEHTFTMPHIFYNLDENKRSRVIN